MTTPKRKVALYARVSTDDKGQEVENQLLKLRAHCEEKGWTIYHEYTDDESGTKGTDKRAAFRQMFNEAEKRRFDLVLFWALDRFSREGIAKTINHLQRLDRYGVKWKSYTEPYLDTDDELISHIVIGVLAYFAKLQRDKISANTKSGMERARRQGKHVGRPGLTKAEKEEIVSAWKEHGTLYRASKELGRPYSTVKKVVNDHKANFLVESYEDRKV